MSANSKGAWLDAVIRAVQQLPADLQWRVQVGCMQTLPPIVCRRCSGTEFRVASPATVSCFACGVLTGLDTAGCFGGGCLNLGHERRRVRILVRPLDGEPQRIVTATWWRSEQAAGLWGTVDRRHHTPPIVYIPHAGWHRPNSTWTLMRKIEEAVLSALACAQGDRWIWHRPDGTVVFEKDREEAARLARLEVEQAERRRKEGVRGIVPVELTPVRPEAEVLTWLQSRAACHGIFPRLVAALRHAFPMRQAHEVRAAAAAVLRGGIVAPLEQLGAGRWSDVREEVEGAWRARQWVRAFRCTLSETDQSEMYTLPLKERVGELRALRASFGSEECRVQRMYDWLLDPETESGAELKKPTMTP